MTALTFSLKLCISERDIRRTTIDITSISQFKYEDFARALHALAPEVRFVKWKDADGDKIRLRTDSDLADALKNLEPSRGTPVLCVFPDVDHAQIGIQAMSIQHPINVHNTATSAIPQMSVGSPSLHYRDTPSTQSVGSSSTAIVDLGRRRWRTIPGASGPDGGTSDGEIDLCVDSNYDEISESFDAMNLKEELLRGIIWCGFAKPTAIQQRAVVPCCSGRDVIAQAPPGTGKTATLAISILQQIDVKRPVCQALVIAPTRKLAEQIKTVVITLGEYLQVKCHACIGGTIVDEDWKILVTAGIHVVVGTPGRLTTHMIRRGFCTRTIKIFVVDEVAEITAFPSSMEQTLGMYNAMPESVQVLLFGATMSPKVFDFTKKWVQDPLHIKVNQDKFEWMLEGIRQFYVFVENEPRKAGLLHGEELASTLPTTSTEIDHTLNVTVNLACELIPKLQPEVPNVGQHAGTERAERERIMQEFCSGSTRMLITTDLFDYGIDVQCVSLVINYDLCDNRGSYIRRIGRRGQFSKKSVAINLITEEDKLTMKDFEDYYNTQIDVLPKNFTDLL